MSDITSYLNKILKVKIDRPLGSLHPKHGFRYDANYGYIPGTKNADGEEIDAYVLGISQPIEEFEGKCVAVVHRTNDDDDKLIVVPKGVEGITDEEIRKQTDFQEKYFQSVILRS